MTPELIQEKLKIFDNRNFIFNEEQHAYSLNGTSLKSVTTFLKKFSKPFDEEFWSKKKAKDALLSKGDELTQENILAEQIIIKQSWKNKAAVSCDLGTAVHLYIEEFTANRNITPTNDEIVKSRIVKFHEIYDNKLKDSIIPVGQEIRIFNEKLGLAGTIDALYIRRGKLEIWDYKTNAEFKNDESKNYSKLLEPFKDHWENDLNKYSIQLSLYKLILATVGIKVDGENVLLHIPPGENKAVLHKCKDFVYVLEDYFKVKYYSEL